MKLEPGRRKFTQADYEPLRMHYDEKTLQIHIMAEYARQGLNSIGNAPWHAPAMWGARAKALGAPPMAWFRTATWPVFAPPLTQSDGARSSTCKVDPWCSHDAPIKPAHVSQGSSLGQRDDTVRSLLSKGQPNLFLQPIPQQPNAFRSRHLRGRDQPVGRRHTNRFRSASKAPAECRPRSAGFFRARSPGRRWRPEA